MRLPDSLPLFICNRFLTLIGDSARRVEFYRSLRPLACVPRAVSMHVTTDPLTPGQDIIRLALTTEDQRWGLAGANHGQVGLFHFTFRSSS